MGEDTDDWGNPIKPRYQPRDQSYGGLIRSWYYLIRRRYQGLVTTVLLGLCLLWYLGSGGEARPPPVDWKRFAYVQYVTDNHNLCNAYMVFESLHRFKSKADRVLLYPREWDLEEESEQDRNSQLLVRAKKYWNVKLHPVDLLDTDGKAEPGTLNAPSSWSTSITKLRAFELYEYDRVLHLDSDITLLQHMDELFLAPSAAIAMPRAYWSDEKPNEWPLTSLLMLIEPNPLELKNFIDILMSWKMKPGFQVGRNYDMDLLNHRFGSSAMVLPHRGYAMLSAEFRKKDHSAYLGTINGPRERMSKLSWDADRAYKETKLVHFSDWPLPKPWVMWPHEGLAEMQPDCDGSKAGCREREIWKGLYADFRKRRKDLCRILSVPAPKWDDIKNQTAS